MDGSLRHLQPALHWVQLITSWFSLSGINQLLEWTIFRHTCSLDTSCQQQVTTTCIFSGTNKVYLSPQDIHYTYPSIALKEGYQYGLCKGCLQQGAAFGCKSSDYRDSRVSVYQQFLDCLTILATGESRKWFMLSLLPCGFKRVMMA